MAKVEEKLKLQEIVAMRIRLRQVFMGMPGDRNKRYFCTNTVEEDILD